MSSNNQYTANAMRRAFRILAAVIALIGGGLSGPHAQIPLTGAGRGAPASGGVSIAFVNAADGGNATATSLTFSYTVGSGSNRLLVVPVIGDATTDDVTGVTYAGAAMTLAVKQNPSGHPANRWLYEFFLVNPTSGANNVVVSATSSHFLAGGAADYTGVKSSGQPDAPASQNGGGPLTTLTTSITTVADNSWAILVENGFNSNNPPTAGTGLTRRAFDAAFGAWGIFDSAGPITPAGSYSMTTNRSGVSDAIIHAAASFSHP